MSQPRSSHQISEREIAIALVLTLANHHANEFSNLLFRDTLTARLNVVDNNPFQDKLVRVTRKLVRNGVLFGRWRHCWKEYAGEPTKLMVYGFYSPGKHRLLTMGKTEHTWEPEVEAAYLIRRVYPDPAGQ